jgi:hypothetical protein
LWKSERESEIGWAQIFKGLIPEMQQSVEVSHSSAEQKVLASKKKSEEDDSETNLIQEIRARVACFRVA